ncbi:ATP-binding cassette domain-containing protein [Brachybacterium sp. DNPG3]
MADDDDVVQVHELTKTFGPVRALDGFSLRVPAGQVTGFLGPNGAGKSTALRILLGMLRRTSGSASVLGMDPWTDAVAIHRRLAYVPGDTVLWPGLTGGEAIDVLTRSEARSGAAALRRRRDRLLERFDLDPTKRCRTYSKGNRQKVALVAALSRNVELLLLDEPTSGLDPLMEAVFTEEIRALREEGRTVLLSSHILGEVEKLCDRVTIIRAGRDVESGTLPQLRHLTRSSVAASLPHRDPAPREGEDRQEEDPLAALRALPGVHGLVVDGTRLRFDIDDDAVPQVLPVLLGIGATGLSIAPPSLEELFLRHYGTGETTTSTSTSGSDPSVPDPSTSARGSHRADRP